MLNSDLHRPIFRCPQQTYETVVKFYFARCLSISLPFSLQFSTEAPIFRLDLLLPQLLDQQWYHSSGRTISQQCKTVLLDLATQFSVTPSQSSPFLPQHGLGNPPSVRFFVTPNLLTDGNNHGDDTPFLKGSTRKRRVGTAHT
jgi:hypothetical protein